MSCTFLVTVGETGAQWTVSVSKLLGLLAPTCWCTRCQVSKFDWKECEFYRGHHTVRESRPGANRSSSYLQLQTPWKFRSSPSANSCNIVLRWKLRSADLNGQAYLLGRYLHSNSSALHTLRTLAKLIRDTSPVVHEKAVTLWATLARNGSLRS